MERDSAFLEQIKRETKQIMSKNTQIDIGEYAYMRTDAISESLDEITVKIAASVLKEVKNIIMEYPDMYAIDIFPEPWLGWQKDVNELAREHGRSIVCISAHYARWQNKVTRDFILREIDDIITA